MEELVKFYEVKAIAVEGSCEVSLIQELVALNRPETKSTDNWPISVSLTSPLDDHVSFTNWLKQSPNVFISFNAASSYYADLDSVTFVKSQVRNSLEACNERLEQLVAAAPGSELFASGGASLWADTPVACSFATPLSIPAIEPDVPVTNGFTFSPTTYSEIAELNAKLILGLLRQLRSHVRVLAECLKFLTTLVSLLIRRVGRPTFQNTFLGMQKEFHFCHGAHPPRIPAGLSYGRRPGLFGGCGTAIPSGTVR